VLQRFCGLPKQRIDRLLRGLSSRSLKISPVLAEHPEIAELHFRAIDSFSELATALGGETASKREHLWKSAMDVAAAWLSAVIRL
jgi:hypothetical protein